MSIQSSREVTIDAGGVPLVGDLAVPARASGIVVFVHGSGSGRKSPRNQYVASQLRGAGFATLLFDLLTVSEEEAERYTRHLRFNIPLLADRVTSSLAWLARSHEVTGLPIGLFGASTGAAAALIAATRVATVDAVVSRGGRPDLAGDALDQIFTPTLLIVGGNDPQVLALNRAAFARLSGPRELHVVPGATHLFEEPGALDEVIDVTAAWFRKHLSRATPRVEMDRASQQPRAKR